MNLKNLLICCIILLYVTPIYSEDLSNIQASFLDVGYGGRPMGMGGAYVSLAETANSILWNPAGLANFTNKHNLTFDNVTILDLYNYSFAGYAYNINNLFSTGVGLTYSGDAAMSETIAYLSFAGNGKFLGDNIFKYINFGFNLKYFGASFGNNSDGSYIEENLEHQVSGSAYGYGLDFGLQIITSEFYKLGIVYKNPVNDISWESSNGTNTALGSYNEDLPSMLIFGFSFTNDIFTISLDCNKSLYQDTEDIILTGFEYSLFNKLLNLRAGYSQELFTAQNKKYSFGFGTRFNIWKKTVLNIDFAYQIYTVWEGSNILRFSIDITQ